MGVAEVIPGVSGGTIAFITGIYERLLNAIRAFNPGLVNILRKEGIASAFKAIDGLFLIKLFAGMVLGFILGLKIITSMLETYPIQVWSFFFGLILASIPLVARRITQIRWQEILMFLLGTVFVYWVTIAAPSQGTEALWFVFLSGVLAISALMLPGLSGSFVLLLLGMYTVIMPAIKDFLDHPFGPETKMLITFGLGIIVGVFSFARVLSWTFARYKNQTLALLTGFLLGSLNKVWPWQKVLETRIDSKGFEKVVFSESVLPSTMENLSKNFHYGTNAHLVSAIAVMLISVLVILLLDRFSPKEA